jgi:hypothetical protein
MKVLIACEESQAVCIAFRNRGHEAYSCDIQPCSGGHPEWHIQGNMLSVRQETWDFVGYHYTCTVMANSGVRWLYEKEGRWEELEEACKIFNLTLTDDRPGYSENPIQHKHTKARIIRGQDQVIQPWWFGDPYFKATCIWLRGGIPKLTPTNKLIPPKKGTKEYKRWSMVHCCPPGPNRATIRSRTFPGIAEAMASQWGKL